MSWCTWVTADIEFNRKTYAHKYDMDEDLQYSENAEKFAFNKLVSLVSMNPELLRETDCEDEKIPLEDSIIGKVNDALRMYKDAVIEHYKLELLAENWDKRQGDFIRPEDNGEDE